MLPEPKKPLVSVASLEAELKALVEPLQTQLKNSRWPNEKEKIRQKIDLLTKIHKEAIESAKIDERLYEARLKNFQQQQETRQATIKAEKREILYQEYLQAGGDPNNFEDDLPEIERAIIHQKMIGALTGQQKPRPSIIQL